MGAEVILSMREVFPEEDFVEGGGRNEDSLITGSFFTGHALGNTSMMMVVGEDILFIGDIFENSC